MLIIGGGILLHCCWQKEKDRSGKARAILPWRRKKCRLHVEEFWEEGQHRLAVHQFKRVGHKERVIFLILGRTKPFPLGGEKKGKGYGGRKKEKCILLTDTIPWKRSRRANETKPKQYRYCREWNGERQSSHLYATKKEGRRETLA